MNKSAYFKQIPIILLIALNLAVGLWVFPDYGESWDEARLYEYGEQSLNAYRALANPAIPVDFGDDDLRYYGPAYFMSMSLLVHGLHNIFPQVLLIDLWHLGNFVCLQLGLLFFYLLLRRFFDLVSALAAAALFASQPLIWGHGFINPKDIPFMTFFTASVYLGLRMLDEFERQGFDLKNLVRNAWFYAAAGALGLTISIRILGFAAAGVVLFYFAFINTRKVLRLSYPYFGVSLAVSFLTWPYLWSSPITNFLQGIYAMIKFQWIGHTLYQGIYYPTNQLPRSYVPTLLSMQLTESALILFAAGLLTIMGASARKKHQRPLILFVAWFLFPLFYILINGMNLYDNTRQLLFIVPGLFLIIAIGMDFIFNFIKPTWGKILLLLIAILPGVAGMVRYHPYEYTYYNVWTTSRQQIYRNYETDYWATSFKDAAQYLNENAVRDSQVIVWGPAQLIRRYGREDLDVKSFDDLKDRSYASQPYYLVLTTRYDTDRAFFPDVPPVYSVQHNGIVLAVIRYITP